MKKINLYAESIIFQKAFVDEKLIKQADFDGIFNFIKSHFSNINKDNIMEFITPTAIFSLIKLLGFKFAIFGAIIYIISKQFNIDIKEKIYSFYEKIKSILEKDGNISEQEFNSITDSTFGEVKQSFNKKLINARLVKLSSVLYPIEKFAIFQQKTKILSFFWSFIVWLFKIALTSAGVFTTTKIIEHVVEEKKQEEKKEEKKEKEEKISTFFKLNPSYQDKKYNTGNFTWAEGFINNESGISDMLISFAKEVYNGLEGYESIIKSLPSFIEVVNEIEDFNLTSKGSRIVFLPRMFNSKKQIVDLFMKYVADKIKK